MSNVEALKIAIEHEFEDIIKHSLALALGLQNAAPAEIGGPPKSVLYLTDIAKGLKELHNQLMNTNPLLLPTLLEIVHEATQRDSNLRAKHQVGDKFRFVREKLQGLVKHIEKETAEVNELEQKSKKEVVSKDEVVVYVYLYNAHGITLSSWQKFLSPSVFYEHSVNRPIYLERSAVEALIRARTHRAHHGYLAVAIKREDILSSGESGFKDAVGGTLIKIKEGSLHFERLFTFTHNGEDYTVNEKGGLEKKVS